MLHFTVHKDFRTAQLCQKIVIIIGLRFSKTAKVLNTSILRFKKLMIYNNVKIC